MIKLSLKKKKNSFIIDYFKSAREFFTNSTMLIPKMQSVFWYVKVLAPFFFLCKSPRQLNTGKLCNARTAPVNDHCVFPYRVGGDRRARSNSVPSVQACQINTALPTKIRNLSQFESKPGIQRKKIS